MMADGEMLKLYVFFACLSTTICIQWKRLSEDPEAKNKLLNFLKNQAGTKLYQMDLEGTLENYSKCFWDENEHHDIEQCERLVGNSVILRGYYDAKKSAIEVVNDVIDNWRGKENKEPFKDFKEFISKAADKNSVACVYGDVSGFYALETDEAKSSLALETNGETIGVFMCLLQ